MIFPQIRKKIDSLEVEKIDDSRFNQINRHVEIIHKIKSENLVFICTHNSRRSQFAQAWATVLNDYYGLPYQINSAGTEKTAVHPHVLEVLKSEGMEIAEIKNGKFKLSYDTDSAIILYSKLIDEINENFIAIMTCDDADRNCPVIPEAEARLRLSYTDPGKHDGTEHALEKYKKCSTTILSELNLLFKKLSNS